ncbi:hypothetical protein [Devosia sp.]|jgi:hypothetical protein|uniref:hypothetical protein n=1 Tax=Devosia sp. TaxID=1871048 RepID=UPI003F706322
MRLLTSLVVCIASLWVATSASALELVVRDIDKGLANALFYGSKAEAEGYVSGYTVLLKMGQQPPYLRRRLEFSSNAVLYFAKGGTLLAWSGQSAQVQAGTWRIMRGGNFNEVCVEFAKGRGQPACASPLSGGMNWMKQSTPGNPFGLKAGAAVPFKFGTAGLSLEKIAAKFP